MNRRLIILGATILTLASVVLSFSVIKPAKPIIDIKGEKLLTVGPLDITNTLFTAWVAMVLLVGFWLLVTRKREMVPSGLQNLGEAIIEVILGFVTNIAGERNARRFFPLIATLFIYIAFANWLSLTPLFNTIGIFEPVAHEEEEFHERAVVFREGGVNLILPGAKDLELKIDETKCAGLSGVERTHCLDEEREHAIEVASEGLKENEKAGILAPYLRGINTDLMTPLSFAIVSAFFVEYWGIASLGFFRYMGKFFNFSSPISFFVGVLEFVAELARLVSFSFRLFGNMLAGEILLLVMTFLMPLVSVVLVVFYGLELFVGAIQAFVFGALTLVFAVLAVSHHGPEGHGEGAGH